MASSGFGLLYSETINETLEEGNNQKPLARSMQSSGDASSLSISSQPSLGISMIRADDQSSEAFVGDSDLTKSEMCEVICQRYMCGSEVCCARVQEVCGCLKETCSPIRRRGLEFREWFNRFKKELRRFKRKFKA